jgi:heme/copper-type cytochrome/quinol oxidase subunit 1
MNWDAIGAIGEIVGAAAVVFFLIYLAVQLRQSAKFTRTEYHTKTINMRAPSAHWRTASSDNARIF